MRSGLAGREADDAGFDSPVGVNPQRAAEAARLVVRMSSDTHEPKHAEIVSDVQTFAEMVQPIASSGGFTLVRAVAQTCFRKGYRENQHPN